MYTCRGNGETFLHKKKKKKIKYWGNNGKKKPMVFFTELGKNNYKTCIETLKTLKNQNNFDKEQSGKYHVP